MIARTIAARDLLRTTRQTFFVPTGGSDHHDDVLSHQDTMLPIVASALAETMKKSGGSARSTRSGRLPRTGRCSSTPKTA